MEIFIDFYFLQGQVITHVTVNASKNDLTSGQAVLKTGL